MLLFSIVPTTQTSFNFFLACRLWKIPTVKLWLPLYLLVHQDWHSNNEDAQLAAKEAQRTPERIRQVQHDWSEEEILFSDGSVRFARSLLCSCLFEQVWILIRIQRGC